MLVFGVGVHMVRLRLVTFNIAHGRGLTPIQGFTSARKLRLNLRKIAALLEKLKPDVVAMQEVDERSRWSGNFDHLDYLRVHGAFPHSVFGINNRRHGLFNLCYGNALLSRHTILHAETVVFGRSSVGEKGFLFTEIEIEGCCVPVVNLHLHYGSRAQRLRQIDRLLAWLRDQHRLRGGGWTVAPIICGDFNTPTGDDATAALFSHLLDYGDYELHPKLTPTFPSPMPRWALDFVFLPAGCKLVSCEVVKTMLSDHRPVLVEVEIEHPAEARGLARLPRAEVGFGYFRGVWRRK